MTDERVILITGTSKGIGLFLAQHYISRGYHVVGCSRSTGVLTHDSYHHVIADIGDERSAVRLVREVRTLFGRLDVLVNNAGIASMNHSLLTPGSVVQKVLSTNVMGTFFVSREAAKLMQGRRFGRIVNFSTVAVPLQLEGEAIYAASKAAVVSLTQVLAREFASFGITVNAIGPTPIDTDLIAGVPSKKIDALVERQAIRRKGTFADVANVIDFFLQDESDFITGQVVYLGGIS